jgi:hypothetical protein
VRCTMHRRGGIRGGDQQVGNRSERAQALLVQQSCFHGMYRSEEEPGFTRMRNGRGNSQQREPRLLKNSVRADRESYWDAFPVC